MKYKELRPVLVHTHFRHRLEMPESGGLFHCWAGTSERAYALIELFDGRVIDVAQHDFHFTDQFWNSQWMSVMRATKEEE